MKQHSRQVTSNQTGVHDNLEPVVLRNWHSEFQKPIQPHNEAAFEQLLPVIANQPLIFDAGCGTGRSTKVIADRFPEAHVVGLDKSLHRLERHPAGPNRREHHEASDASNLHLVHTDLVDFWRLAHQAGLRLARHYILYPNPWPKKQHLQRRWHGSPLLRTIIELGGELEIRSNWLLYLEEFAFALELVGQSAVIEPIPTDSEALSAFESKYRSSGQPLWRLRATLITTSD